MFISGRELIDIAVGIERNGAAFYDALTDSTLGLKAGSVYKYLADNERQHLDLFRSMLASVGEDRLPETYGEEYDVYLKSLIDSSVFTDDQVAREMAREVASDVEAVQIGLGAEKDSILFYSAMQDLVQRSDRKVVSKIIEEERSHLRQLLDLKKGLGSY